MRSRSLRQNFAGIVVENDYLAGGGAAIEAETKHEQSLNSARIRGN